MKEQEKQYSKTKPNKDKQRRLREIRESEDDFNPKNWQNAIEDDDVIPNKFIPAEE